MSTLKLEKRISTLENFQVLVRTFEIFPGTSTLKNEIQKYVQNATLDFPAFPSPRALKRLSCGSPVQKLLYLNYCINWNNSRRGSSDVGRSMIRGGGGY